MRSKYIASVNVLWKNNRIKEASWEVDHDICSRYPLLFEFMDDNVKGID